jgi:hypothetical protein
LKCCRHTNWGCKKDTLLLEVCGLLYVHSDSIQKK